MTTGEVSNGGQEENKKLIQRSQLRHSSELSCGTQSQYITALTTVWTETLWAFPERYAADKSWIGNSSNGGQQEEKRARTSTIKVSFYTLYVRVSV